MKKITVIDRFQTGWGLILAVETSEAINPGDVVCVDSVVYEVVRIMLSTRPQGVERIGLVVKVKSENSQEI